MRADPSGYSCFSVLCHRRSHWAVVCDPRAKPDGDLDNGNLFTDHHWSLADSISRTLTGEQIAVVDVCGAA